MTKKNGVFVIRRKDTKSIVGFSTLLKMTMRVNGKKIIGIFSGDTILEEAFWGSRSLNRRFFGYVVEQIARHPFTPVYWLLISKGYKTYLLLANNFLDHYPCYNKEQKHLADIAKAYSTYLFEDCYDPERKLLDFGNDYQCLKTGVAEITDEMCRKNAKIAYFVEKNQTWAKGTELPCVGKLSWKSIIYYMLKSIGQWMTKRKNPLRSSAKKRISDPVG